MKVNKANEFYKILERKAIYPVFQPIVNLQDVYKRQIHSRLPAAMEFWLVCLGIVVCEQ